MRALMILLLVATTGPALAQSSASYHVTDHAFNAGGHPDKGVIMSSTGFRVTLDSIGDGTGIAGLSSVSYGMDSGFALTYPPPGEVRGLRFIDSETLVWNPEKSFGVYNLYRGLISSLTGLGYGSCKEQDLASETATDSDPLATEDGYFYLVTAENRLTEEGTKGFDSYGSERPNPSPCP